MTVTNRPEHNESPNVVGIEPKPRKPQEPQTTVSPDDEEHHHSYAIWSLYKYDENAPEHKDVRVCRAKNYLGLHLSESIGKATEKRWNHAIKYIRQAILIVLDDANIVLNDVNVGFRQRSEIWGKGLAFSFEQAKPWIILKMARPAAKGKLWEHLISNKLWDRLIVMRMRQLRGLLHRLKALQIMKLSSKNLLLKLGEAKARYRAAWRLFDFDLPEAKSQDNAATFGFRLNRKKLREARRREGRYLLRTNLCQHDPVELWSFYIQLVEIEAVFKNLKDDLCLRPIFHRREDRIEAHIFVAFLAYCLHVTLRARLRPLAPGLTPRAVLDKFAAIQMLDVHFPTTDGRTLILSRYTQPEADQKILLEQLRLQLPAQPPPRITSKGTLHH